MGGSGLPPQLPRRSALFPAYGEPKPSPGAASACRALVPTPAPCKSVTGQNLRRVRPPGRSACTHDTPGAPQTHPGGVEPRCRLQGTATALHSCGLLLGGAGALLGGRSVGGQAALGTKPPCSPAVWGHSIAANSAPVHSQAFIRPDHDTPDRQIFAGGRSSSGSSSQRRGRCSNSPGVSGTPGRVSERYTPLLWPPPWLSSSQ